MKQMLLVGLGGCVGSMARYKPGGYFTTIRMTGIHLAFVVNARLWRASCRLSRAAR
jgi:fluoride ion exporter CrcB/FEX